MKKKFPILAIFTIIFYNSLISQDFVSTQPQPRNVVLEEFTGIHCGNCPGGQKKAKELSEANPGRVVLISIHEGSYAVPKQGEPDFRTSWGAAILSSARVSGFPAGTINRQNFPGNNSFPYYVQITGGFAMSPTGWAPASNDSILNGSLSPVNIAAKTKWDNSTRKLEIEVEAYFTDNILNGAKLNIALLESHVWGPQTGASDPSNYEHNHILRELITGQWGELISASTKDELFKKTYEYFVDEKFNILNCDLALFVTQSDNKRIFTGIDIHVIPPNSKLTNLGDNIIATKSSSEKSNSYEIQNISDKQVTYKVTVTKAIGAPSDWSAEFENSINEFTIAPQEKESFNLNIITGTTKGVGDFYITISEKDNPISNPVFDSLTVVTTDISYLEVDAGGSILNTILNARNNFVTLPINSFNKVSSLLDEMKLIVWNTGPTGRFNGNEAALIDEYIKKGIGVLINGAGGIPMLTYDNPSHPLFSTLGVTWSQSNEIDLPNFTLVGVSGDPVSDGFTAPGLNAANNGYLMQSMTITNPQKSFPMLKMQENGKVISVRVINPTARAVYLGFNLDVITDETLKNNLIKKSLDWIEGIVDVKDFKQSEVIDLKIVPNIVNESSYIYLTNNNNKSQYVKIFMIDILGRKVSEIYKGNISPGINTYTIDCENISSGFYFVITETEGNIFNNILFIR